MPPFELRVEDRRGVPVAVLEGEVDMGNARDLETSLLDEVPNHAPGLVLDLARTSYLDSAGVHVLFDLARRLQARQQQLRLAVPPDAPIRRVLTLTNVEAAAPLHESVEDAVAPITTP